MKFAICIQAPPYSPSAYSGYQFALSCLKKHDISTIFFYGEGVFNTCNVAEKRPDEIHMPSLWQELNQCHKVPLILCSTAGFKYGVISQEVDGLTIDGAEIAGLGEWVAQSSSADKVVVFK